MRDGLVREPRAVAYAREASRRLGRDMRETFVRGGTDGSQFTEKGLPTPNLSTGQHNPHSPLEWACLDEMVKAVEVTNELVQVWAEGAPAR
jgi:tripeptide aminopeptidase